MEIPVLIESVAGNGYRASTSPFAFVVEGATEEEVLRKLRELIEGKMGAGSKVACLEIAVPEESPWLAMAGMWDKDDPLVQEWEQIMAERGQLADPYQDQP